jgi:hypothetical protein
MFWIMVGQASFHTAFPIGPSTMARSKVLPGLAGGVELLREAWGGEVWVKRGF